MNITRTQNAPQAKKAAVAPQAEQGQQKPEPAPVKDVFVDSFSKNLDENGSLVTSVAGALFTSTLAPAGAGFGGKFLYALGGAVAGRIAGGFVMDAAGDLGESAFSSNPQAGKMAGQTAGIAIFAGLTGGVGSAIGGVGAIGLMSGLDTYLATRE